MAATATAPSKAARRERYRTADILHPEAAPDESPAITRKPYLPARLTRPWPDDESFLMIASGREDDSLLMMYMKFRVWRHYHHENVVLSAATPSLASSGFADRRLRLQNLSAAIHAALEVDVVRTAQFARILVLDVSWRLEGVGRAAHSAARGRGFASGDGHWWDSGRAARDFVAARR